jgi:hypothetical protein
VVYLSVRLISKLAGTFPTSIKISTIGLLRVLLRVWAGFYEGPGNPGRQFVVVRRSKGRDRRRC